MGRVHFGNHDHFCQQRNTNFEMASAPSAPGVWEVELTRLVPVGAILPADGLAGIGLSFAMDSYG